MTLMDSTVRTCNVYVFTHINTNTKLSMILHTYVSFYKIVAGNDVQFTTLLSPANSHSPSPHIAMLVQR